MPAFEQFRGAGGHRSGHRRSVLVAVLTLLFTGLWGSGADADVPVWPHYDGAMTFPSIQDVSGPEEFSWQVTLHEGQELELIDEQHARVFYSEEDRLSWEITAMQAHDAIGTDVPTSLRVSEGDVVTLVVHHRAGNPAAGGAPFVYPIIAGAGWEGGFTTIVVRIPPGEVEPVSTPEPIVPGCHVPKLDELTLKQARKRLKNAHCKVGRVSQRGRSTAKTGRVVGQSPRPGRALAFGASVNVILAPN